MHVTLDNGTVGKAGIAFTGVGPRNARAREAEQALAGQEPSEEAITRRPRSPPRAAEPWDDPAEPPSTSATSCGSSPSGACGRQSSGALRGRGSEATTEAPILTRAITVTVNGQPREAEVETRLLLVHFLRETLGLTGTHIGCDTTSCGACTVLLDGSR